MKPKRIILIRHGESEGNVDKGVYDIKPDYALLLTENGKHQAGNSGKELKNIIGEERVKFYISPMFRTRMTFENLVQQLNPGQFDYVEEPRLREQEWGHLRSIEEGKAVEKLRDAYGTFYYRIPDGESAADVYDRVSDFFATLHRDFAKEGYPENVVIVTHGMTLRLFLMRWFHWTVEEFETKANPDNCEIVVMERNGSSKYKLMTDLGIKDKVDHGYQRPINLTKSDTPVSP